MSPRGSDAAAAGAELQARTGMSPNAEKMIEANKARMTRELRAATARSVDYKATEAMDADEAQGFVEGEGQVVAYTVRGPFIVLVCEDESGSLHKQAHVLKGKEKQAQRAMSTRAVGREEEGESHRRRERPESTERRTRPAPPTSE